MQRRKEVWKSEELAIFSQQLANLLASGIPLISSLELLSDQQVISEKAAKGLIQSLKQGASFSKALQNETFPDLFISFICAAEEHGDYVFGLKQCDSYYTARAKLVQEMMQACTYPFIVLFCVGLALTFMVTVVLPRFAELYQTLGVELPLMTRYMLALTELIQIFLWIGGVVMVVVLLLWFWIQWGSESIKPKLEQLFISIPIVKTFYRFHMTHYVAIQLGSLLKSGVPLLRSLELMKKLSPWILLSKTIACVKEHIVTGMSLHQSINQANFSSTLFLTSLSKMVAIGETSGHLDQSLLSLAASTERLMQNQLKRWIRSLEPILIFCLGIFIAITVIAMFLPMLQMIQAV